MKQCATCGLEKAEDEFPFYPHTKVIQASCRACVRRDVKRKSAEKRAADPDRTAQHRASSKERNKRYRTRLRTDNDAQLEKYRAHSRRYQRRLRTILTEQSLRYLTLQREAKRRYKATDKGKAHVLAYMQARRSACEPFYAIFKTEIDAIYEERIRITTETGVEHHVDHIVPLNGTNFSGLHVPWNLRVIPAADNIAKSNKLLPVLHDSLVFNLATKG